MRPVRPFVIVLCIVVMFVAACSADDSTVERADETSGPFTGETTTSFAPATIESATTTSMPTAGWAGLPDHLKDRNWHVGTYESPGYDCPGLDHPHPVQYTNAWVGHDDPDVPADFIDFFGDFTAGQQEADALEDIFGVEVEAPMLVKTCHGIHVKQLDRAPPGLDVGGEAWIRLTVRSLSAGDHAAANGVLIPTSDGKGFWAGAKGQGDPLDMTPTATSGGRTVEKRWPTHHIESIILVATNHIMSQWIISFDEPGTYAYSAGYWGFDDNCYGLNINFLRL